MSRTWRKIPRRAGRRAAPSSPHNPGGAIASNGPSPERFRPIAGHDAATLLIAAELLAQAANRITIASDPVPILWQLAAEQGYAPERMAPALELAQRAISQLSAKSVRLTPRMFFAASDCLKALVNAPTANPEAPRDTTLVPDGRQSDTRIPYWRDHRVTGLRAADHRRARREAKHELARPTDAESSVRAGKVRRYTDKYGEYYF